MSTLNYFPLLERTPQLPKFAVSEIHRLFILLYLYFSSYPGVPGPPRNPGRGAALGGKDSGEQGPDDALRKRTIIDRIYIVKTEP